MYHISRFPELIGRSLDSESSEVGLYAKIRLKTIAPSLTTPAEAAERLSPIVWIISCYFIFFNNLF
jgi:hypothetical protein